MATQKADGSIYIKTEIDTTEAKASVKEIASLLKRLSNQAKTIGKSMEKAMGGSIKTPDTKGMDVVEEKARSVADELEKTAQAEKKIDNINVKTTAFDILDKAIESTGQKLAELEKAQMDIFNRNQSATSSSAFQAMESAAAKLDQQYEQLITKKKQLEAPTASTDSGLPKTGKLTGGTGLASEESTKALQKLNAEITGTETSVESLNADLGQTAQLQNDISNSDIKTTAYQILEDSLQRLDTQFEQVTTAQQEIFARNQSATSSPAFLAMESAAEKLGRQYDELLAKKKQLDSGTTTTQPTEKVRTAPITGNYAKTASEESEKALNALNKEISKTDAKERSLVGTNGKLGSSYINIGSKVAETNGKLSKTRILATLLSSGISKLGNALKKVGSSALSVGKRIGSLATSFLNTSQSADNARFSIGRMVGMSVLYSTVFGMIGKVNSAVASGMQNLAQYSNRTNAALSSLMSALTRLKNSFATAFSPILTAVAPALVTLINLLSKALTYIGMFIAALTGQKTFTKAVGVQQDYAASLGSTSSATDDATSSTNKNAKATKKATKENQNYLSGLDEIRQFQEKSKDTDSDTTPSSGGGSGGGGGGIGVGDMFEEVPIASSIQGIVDKIKKLIEAEDWEGLGEYIATGINKGLQKIYNAISWDNVGPKITYFVNAFTRTFNSLVDNIDWDLMGRTVGTGINTLVNTLNLLIEGIDWKNLGTKFSEGFRGLVDEVNWTNLGNLFGNKFMIAWNILNGFVSDMSRKSNLGLTGWEELGTSLGKLVNGIFDKVDFTTIADTLTKGINGAFSTLAAFVKTVDWSGIATNITNGLNAMITGIDWATAGQTLSDAVTSLLGVFASVAQNTDWNGLGKGIGTFLSNIDWGTIFSQVFTIMSNVLGGLISGFASTTAGKLGIALATAIGAIKLANAFTTLFTNQSLLSFIAKIIADKTGIVGIVETALGSGFTKILSAGGTIAKVLSTGATTLVTSLGSILSTIGTVIFSPTGLLILGIIAGVALIVLNWDKIKAAALKVYEVAKGAWENLQSAFDAVRQKVEAIGNKIRGAWDKVKESAGNVAEKAKQAWNGFKGAFETVGEKINGIGAKIKSVWDGLKTKTESVWKKIQNAVKTPVNAIIGFINTMISAVQSGINAMVHALNNFHISIPDWVPGVGGKSVGFNLSTVSFSKVPYLAKGAVIPPNAPFMAVLGDQRKGTNIETPESLLRQIMREELSNLSTNNNSGGTYQFTAQINRRTLFDEFIEEAKLRQMNNGRNPFSLA